MPKTQKRRRNEGKTDYLKRMNLLKSGKNRISFRKTNAYLIAQYIESDEAQDKIILGITSKELIKYGWPKEAKGSLKSIPASYLMGYLIGKKTRDKKLEKPIIDFGMIRIKHKTKIFGFLKGVIDSGVEIDCNEETFPEEERIKGSSLKNKIDFEKIKSNIEKK